MAQIDDVDRLAGIEPTLQLFRFQARGGEFLQHRAATIEAAEEKADNAEREQHAGEAANPRKQAGIALEQIAKEAAAGQQRAGPERSTDAVVDQKSAVIHAVLAGDRRSENAQARNELGEHQHHAAAAAKRVLRAADA